MFFIYNIGDFESFFMVVEIISLALIFFLFFRKKNNKVIESEEGFECGFDCFYKEKIRFCVRFIKLAILFLLIDLEISFLLPFFQKG